MSETLHIAVLAGTTREQRKSIWAARFIAEVGAGIEGITTELVDPKDFTFNGDGNDPDGDDQHHGRPATGMVARRCSLPCLRICVGGS